MMERPAISAASRRAQRGMVLYVSLLLLLALTLTGLAVSRNITVDERTAAAQRDRDLAFQAAEAALRDGEAVLDAASAGDLDVGPGHYGSSASITWQTADWSDAGKDVALKTLPYHGSLDPMPAHLPRFYIISTAPTDAASGPGTAADGGPGPATVFEIVAKGWGTNANDAVVLESTYELRAPGTGRRLSWRQLQ